ncbi:hypothetical protein Tco_0435867 [Tanacetum coccineum]
MSMIIQSSVKDKILATSSETSKVENTPAEMLRDLDQQMEKRADDGKANVVTDALSRKERVKPRRVRAMAMTIQYGVRGMILTAQSEAFKQENGMMRTVVMDEAHASRIDQKPHLTSYTRNFKDVKYGKDFILIDNSKEWNSGDDHSDLDWMITSWFLETLRKSLYGRIVERIVIWANWRRVCFDLNWYWKQQIRLDSVHDTFHVSNLKKCLADANLHVPLNEIKIDKTLQFVEEPVKIMDREIRNLKCSKISLVKVRWNSKRGPEFTWEREDHIKFKYPRLFVDRAVESAS